MIPAPRDYGDLVPRAAAGDSRALAALAVELRPVLAYRARKWAWLLGRSEADQVARLGLWHAAKTYDPAFGRGFRAHADQRIAADLRRAANRERDWADFAAHDETERGDWIDTMPGRPLDMIARLDAPRLLARLPEREARVLWRVACGETHVDIAGGVVSRERVGAIHDNAMRLAARVARRAA